MLKKVTLTIPQRLDDDAAMPAKQTHSPLEELLADAIDLETLKARMIVELPEQDERLERQRENMRSYSRDPKAFLNRLESLWFENAR